LNKGTLPIIARLQSLQTAARFAPGRARVVADMAAPNPLADLLRAVNETMIGRSLQFDCPGGPSLTLDVAGRRVLRVTSAIGLPGAETCLGVEVLEDEHKDDLIKLLQGIATPRQELRLISGPIGRGGEEVSVGLPVALLADLLLIDLNLPDIAEPLAQDTPTAVAPAEAVFAPMPGASLADGSGLADFAGTVGPELVAWLISAGEDDGHTSGPEEMVSHLQGFLDDEREAIDRQLDLLSSAPGGPIAMMLGATLIEGHSILCVRLGEGVLLGVIEGNGTRATLSAWRNLMG
jgi:hypothetical protein